MAVSKVILNNTTLMDVTGDTVAANNLLTGYQATGNDGETVIGTVDVPTIESLTVTPSLSQQVFDGNIRVDTRVWGTKIPTSPSGGSGTISPALTIGNLYYVSVRYFYDGDMAPRRTESGYLTISATEQQLETNSYASVSNTTVTISTGNYDDIYADVYKAVLGAYRPVTVNAISRGTDGTPTATKGTVSSNSITITPSVTNTAGYIDGGTKTGTPVTVSASELVSGSKTISSAGTTDVTNYAEAVVASGTEGTPVATKGTVSSHSVTVTPSVTNVAGYISGGTKTGTGVTVSASELVSGTKSITSSGTTDVTNYALASVVEGSVTIGGGSATSNPTISIDEDGLITSSYSKAVIPSKSVGSGYVTIDNVIVGSTTVSGSNTLQLTKRTSSDLTASGATVTAPAGYYPASASKSVASGSATTPATTITANPTISVGSDGLVTATVSGSQSVTPTVSAGYVSSGTAGTVSVSGSATTQLTTQAATTYHPSTTDQTIASGKYLTGAQTINAVTTTNLTAANIADGVTVKIGDVSDDDCVLSITGTHQGGDVTVEPITITQDGTYTAPTGKAYSPVTVNVDGEDPDAVLFYDYDGTVLHRYSKTEFNALSAMPANPTHTGLTSQGWNWSLSDAKAHLVNHSQLDIGQCYIPTDGETKLYITLGSDDLDVAFSFYHNNTSLSIDWGDGTSSEPFVNTGNKTLTHTYSAVGNYVVSVDCPTGFWNTTPARIAGTSVTYLPCFNDPQMLRGVNIGNGFENRSADTLSYNVMLEFVTVPSSLYLGSSGSFLSDCYSLKQITVPSSISTLPNYFVRNCYSLQSISMPNSLTTIGNYAISDLRKIERLPIPDSVTSFNNQNLSGMYCLKTIEYPSSVTNAPGVGYGVKLKSITVPNGVTSYGYSATYQYNVESVSLPSTLTTLVSGAFYYNTSLKSITLPNGLTTIGSQVFSSCFNITSLTIPSTVTSIGSSAFYGMYNLRSLTIPSNVTEIDSNTFRECFSLEDLTLPSGIKIKNNNSTYAFYNCRSLKHVSIGFGGTAIPGNTFGNCFNLLDFTIPSTVTEIGDSAFNGCFKLPAITLPSGLTTIGSSAFSACYSLTSVTIPASVTSIKSSAFSSTKSMQEIHLLPTTPPTLANSNAFTGISSTCVFYVPSASLDAYKTASNWSTYASKMVGE